MAAASIQPNIDPLHSNLAQKGKAAIEFIDLFIDSQIDLYGKDHLIPLSLIQSNVVQYNTDEMSRYIGRSIAQFENFVVTRKHLWKTSLNSQGTLVLQKLPAKLRQALVGISKFIQHRSQKDESGGARLKDISSHLGEKFPQIRTELGRGFEGVKSLLLEYPLLFEMAPFDRRYKPLEDLFVRSRIILVDNTILVPEDDSSAALVPARHPPLEGIGRVVYYVPDGFYGFVEDINSSEQAYFALSAVQPDTIKNEDMLRLKAKRQKFKFEATVSKEHLSGTAKNKWRITKMWPCDDTGLVQFSIVSSAKSAGTAAVDRYPSSALGSRPLTESASDFVQLDSCKNDPQANGKSESRGKKPEEAEVKSKPLPNREVGQAPDGAAASEIRAASPIALVTSKKPERIDRQIDIELQTSHRRDITIASKIAPATVWNNLSKRSRFTQKPTAEKRDAHCQTDFMDEREILLRLLRQSPDLLRLVHAVKLDG